MGIGFTYSQFLFIQLCFFIFNSFTYGRVGVYSSTLAARTLIVHNKDSNNIDLCNKKVKKNNLFIFHNIVGN